MCDSIAHFNYMLQYDQNTSSISGNVNSELLYENPALVFA